MVKETQRYRHCDGGMNVEVEHVIFIYGHLPKTCHQRTKAAAMTPPLFEPLLGDFPSDFLPSKVYSCV
jgi:hypothetical protein